MKFDDGQCVFDIMLNLSMDTDDRFLKDLKDIIVIGCQTQVFVIDLSKDKVLMKLEINQS